MVLKEFNMAVPGKGSIAISFYLHFDTHSASVGEINTHADFECNIPRRALLRQENGEWKLYDDHPFLENGTIKVVPEFLNDELSMLIVNKILEIKAEESPM